MSRTTKATILVSILIYATLIGSALAPESRATFARAFGPAPLGVPVAWFVPAVLTVLYLPCPWVLGHVVTLFTRAVDDGVVPTSGRFLLYLTRAGREHPELRRSVRACFVGLGYFLATVVLWIAYAQAAGV